MKYLINFIALLSCRWAWLLLVTSLVIGMHVFMTFETRDPFLIRQVHEIFDKFYCIVELYVSLDTVSDIVSNWYACIV